MVDTFAKDLELAEEDENMYATRVKDSNFSMTRWVDESADLIANNFDS